jgi:hypothetical protein
MASHRDGYEPAARSFTRRGALTALGSGTLAVTATAAAQAAGQQYAGRTYEGESQAGNLQEALDVALKSLGDDLAAGGVADALATWKLSEITGQLGGIAGFRSVKVKLIATRTPPYPSKG